jgi:hypothetical protein
LGLLFAVVVVLSAHRREVELSGNFVGRMPRRKQRHGCTLKRQSNDERHDAAIAIV